MENCFTYKEYKSPVAQILPFIDNISSEGGCQKTGKIGKSIGNAKQGTSKIWRHIQVGAHKTLNKSLNKFYNRSITRNKQGWKHP